MSVLRNLEQKIEAIVEGAFSRAFKSRVQPVELARKLAKEMEDNKTVSVSRVYVPNEYCVFLSPADREQFAGYEEALRKELSDYLLEHARGEGLALLTRPTVSFETDERLGLGEFGIQAQLVKPPEDESGEPELGDFGATMIYSPGREARRLAPPAPAARALLVGAGRRTVLSGDRILVGRSRDCDLVIDDPNVSRRHAELRNQGGSWSVRDLGSTNGVKVNGRRVEQAVLQPGDELTLGLSKLRFEQEPR
ncbi:MAG: FHA domain-containing protein [Thermoleophilaceae bacterium]|nr:FHA domain-containing protein [Thermoleophilaceae bacterium]